MRAPPRLGFSVALASAVASAYVFRVLLDAALGSMPGAAAGLAVFFGPVLLNGHVILKLRDALKKKTKKDALSTTVKE
jgi:hypothetical protein